MHNRYAAMLAASLAAASVSCLCGAATEATASAEATTAGGTESGSWQQRKYTFNFMGFTTTYSCNGLEDKLRLLLKMNGAADAKVSAPCPLGIGRPDKLAMADVTFSSLQPGAAANGTAGEWRHIELSPHHPFELDLGDCELIEEFRYKVLAMFATRNLNNQVTCIPHQDSGSNFHLSYDVFAPVPAKKKS
jgi:hypothetical protein